MEHCNSKEKEVIVDIESGEASELAIAQRDPVSGNKPRKISLNKLVSGVLGYKGSDSNLDEETMELLVEKNPVEQQNNGILPPVGKDNNDKGRTKAVKVKKAPKPPRPPKGPLLDAADMRMVKEISKIAMKKRERIEQVKALKKMKAARLPSQSSSSSLGGTISAMVITVLFFLVLIFQGLGSSSSSNVTVADAPQPAPDTTAAAAGLTPVQFYKTVLSDDGAAPSFVPPKSAE
ncbi:hypothetical protein ABFX02_04G005400 [Erythranthe guttata]